MEKSLRNQSMTERSKKVRYHWLLWWKIEPEELERQVRAYGALGILRSARGQSALLLILSGGVSIILFYVSAEPRPESFVDAMILLGLAVLGYGIMFGGLAAFIYRGHSWAMICAMMFWTLDKTYQICVRPRYAVGSVIWWTAFMQVFYMAYRVEKERRAPPAQMYDLNTAKNPMGTPESHGEAGPPCPECGSPTAARAQQGTGKLYFGCTNFKGGCRFNGCRDVGIQPQSQK